MAELIDEQEVTDEELEAQETEEQQEPELPDKYRGKSIQDLVQMHQEAEKALGKQGSEVGELRKVVDSYIKSQVENQSKQTEQKEDPVDWFTDPDKAMEQKLVSHPKFKQLEMQSEMSRKEQALNKMKQKHPDHMEILQDNAFAAWIQQSPIRTQLFIDADQNYNADAADELLTLWKERRELSKSTVTADKESRKEAIKQASTGAARGSQQPPRKRKYRRSDIIRLMNEDPERYNALADDILLAYKEKRVV